MIKVSRGGPRNAAGVADLAYAGSKWRLYSFCPLLNSSQRSETTKENDLDALGPPFAALLGNIWGFLKDSLPNCYPTISLGAEITSDLLRHVA
jgi:hypothetical protein